MAFIRLNKGIMAFAVTALSLAVSHSIAHSAEVSASTKASDFSANGEFRVRETYFQNKSGNKDDNANKGLNVLESRVKLGLNFRASEKFGFHATLLNNSIWGSNDLLISGSTTGTGDTGPGLPNGVRNGDNMVLLQEAYGTWMVSDSFNVRFGRGGYTMADGSVISVNDYERTPYAFEGALANYELESLRVGLMGVKFANYSADAGAIAGDPDANTIGLSLDLKTLPSWLKTVHAHVFKNSKDYTANASPQTAVPGRDDIRYGVAILGDTMGIDYRFDYAANNGKIKNNGNDTDRKGSMIHAVVGYSIPELVGSRFFVTFHTDTGSDANDTSKNNTYDSFYYDSHNNGGLMDVVRWGNLTYYTVGYTLNPLESTEVGLMYHKFMRTNASGLVTPGTFGDALFGATSPTASSSKDLGYEIDLVATHKYEGGFELQARLGAFKPGQFVQDNNGGKADMYAQGFLQGKMTF